MNFPTKIYSHDEIAQDEQDIRSTIEYLAREAQLLLDGKGSPWPLRRSGIHPPKGSRWTLAALDEINKRIRPHGFVLIAEPYTSTCPSTAASVIWVLMVRVCGLST